MPMNKVTEKAFQIVEPLVESMGYDLVDLEYLVEHGRWILRIFADKAEGITVDDCAAISSELGALLDIKDLFQHPYVLEVSSPGLNRRLRREKDFLQAKGKRIQVRMTAAVNGRRNFTGFLKGVQNGRIELQLEKGEAALNIQDVEKAHLIFEF